MAALLYVLMVTLVMTPSCIAIFSEDQEENITEFIQSVLKCRNIPGLTVSVVHGDRVWAKGFGEADISTGRRVQNDTLFSIGSLGKGFTMALLGVLLQRTSYNWSTKLANIEGVDLTFVSENLTREVTLGDLLSHQTGLSDVADFGFIAGYPEGTSMQCMSNRLKYLPQKNNLREGYFLYNNMMYMILGHVIEVLGKDSWHNLVTSLLLEPLGMASSKTLKCSDDVLVGNVAKPYIMPEDELIDGTEDLYKITPLEPAGGILSNAVDMTKWLKFNLNNGTNVQGEQILDPVLLAEAFKTQKPFSPIVSYLRSNTNPPFPMDDTTDGYGYGWFTSTYRGKTKLWHSGGLFSYISLLWLFPEHDIGLFVSLNGPSVPQLTSNGLYVIMAYLSDMLLGLEPWLDTDTACTFPAPWKKSYPFNFPERPVYANDHIEDFVGVYGNHLLPDIRIEVTGNDEGDKTLRLTWNRIMGDLLPTASNDTFDFKMTEPWEYAIEFYITPTYPITSPVTFNRSDDGQVERFVIKLRDNTPMLYEKGVMFISGCDTETEASSDLWSCDREDADYVSYAKQWEPSKYLLLVSVIAMFSTQE